MKHKVTMSDEEYEIFRYIKVNKFNFDNFRESNENLETLRGSLIIGFVILFFLGLAASIFVGVNIC